MSQLRILAAGIFMVAGSLAVEGQDQAADFYEKTLRINNAGMAVLGTWAVANITVGGIGWNRYEGQQKYFHQMNLMWNTVNLAIAGISLYSNLHTDPSLFTAEEVLDRQLKSQRLFLINAGLDVAYMGTGLLLRSLSDRSAKHQQRLMGYGNSVILQGAFLFVFDLAIFGIQYSHRMNWIDQLSLAPMHGAWGVTACLSF